MEPWLQCERCLTRYPPANRSVLCPHKLVSRDSASLDDLAARMRAGEQIKFEPWKLGEAARAAEQTLAVESATA